jgi:glyceraldehyde 3-phosphate dehydrogenase
MINIGINGFGRIGKCVFLQLINNPKFNICALNSINISLDEISDYLTYDSTHKYSHDFKINILSSSMFSYNHHKIELLSNRNAKDLEWSNYGCEYIIDATGSYLTMEKCLQHKAKYVVMTAPAKDSTNTYIYGANHDLYKGEKIISASSCTTNCIAPLLKLLNDNYVINNCSFTTIHATTSSQYTVDNSQISSRINRTLINNIIPHTTGASSSVVSVLPELLGKIHGTSLRVPVLNCSLVDLNIELNDKCVTLKDIELLLQRNELYDIVYKINNKNLVSSDFNTTTTPTILDIKASIDMGKGRFKLMVWYDNEWSYSSQVIRIVEHMYNMNKSINPNYYFENINMKNKGVVLRVDFNVPTKNNVITDDFRIRSAMSTIEKILKQKPKYLLLTSHFGRPIEKNTKDSLEFLLPIIENYITKMIPSTSSTSSTSLITFLPDGIHLNTLDTLNSQSLQDNNEPQIYLLENLRFHKEETIYEHMSNEEIENNEIINIYRQLADVFVSDAFGCVHRKHMSICDKSVDKKYCYGELIQKEIINLDMIITSNNLKILGIIGGNKIKDKMPLIDSISKIKNSTLFIAGSIAKQYKKTPNTRGDSNIIVMRDGYGNTDVDSEALYINNINQTDYNVYDIGENSLNTLMRLICEADIIFWNGSLGLIEDEKYVKGSNKIVKYLNAYKSKRIIIGGGETASLFKSINDNACENYDNIYISTGGGALLEYLQNKILYNKNIVGIQQFV